MDPLSRTPAAVVRAHALDHNVAAMQSWCTAHRVELAPHGKTTMAPAVFRRQLAAGAWGITVATAWQAQVAAEAGAPRVLVANEVVDAASAADLATLVERGVEVYVYVDSEDGARLLDAALMRPLQVLVEVGLPGLRAGVRDDETALQVARAVTASRHLRLAGVAGFEGLVPVEGEHGRDGEEHVATFCRRIVALAERLDVGLVSAGGSTYMDVVARELTVGAAGHGDRVAVLRSGCYVVHDHGLYRRTTPLARGGDGPALRPALEVWTTVLSRPEPTRAILDAGRRDLSYDAGLPISLRDNTWVAALSDQHAWLDLDAHDPLRVGDRVRLGISHPCTTFDKWHTVLLLDDQDRVIEELDTRFRPRRP